MKILNVIDLGISEYEDTYFLQQKILDDKKRGQGDDYLILVEHPNIFTIGRTGSKKNLLADQNLLEKDGIRILDVDRGGDITFHGIGQLVTYPIFDLRKHIKDIRLFIKNLERVLELTVTEYDLAADSKKEYTGLWVEGKKIGFIGIGISNWITYHGISINANVDLKYFAMIRSCGIENIQVSSLQKLLNRNIELSRLKETVQEKFCEVFDFARSSRHSEDAFMAEEKAS